MLNFSFHTSINNKGTPLKLICSYPTRIGRAAIFFSPINSRYLAFIGEENLGAYLSPQQAVDDLTGGHTFSHSSGIDTALLGLPDDLSEWEQAS